MRIYKYELKITDRQRVEMPLGSKILTAQFQRDVLCLWAMVDESLRLREYKRIVIFGTGNPIPEPSSEYEWKHIASAQQHNGDLVWHIFEEA